MVTRYGEAIETTKIGAGLTWNCSRTSRDVQSTFVSLRVLCASVRRGKRVSVSAITICYRACKGPNLPQSVVWDEEVGHDDSWHVAITYFGPRVGECFRSRYELQHTLPLDQNFNRCRRRQREYRSLYTADSNRDKWTLHRNTSHQYPVIHSVKSASQLYPPICSHQRRNLPNPAEIDAWYRDRATVSQTKCLPRTPPNITFQVVALFFLRQEFEDIRGRVVPRLICAIQDPETPRPPFHRYQSSPALLPREPFVEKGQDL